MLFTRYFILAYPVQFIYMLLREKRAARCICPKPLMISGDLAKHGCRKKNLRPRMMIAFEASAEALSIIIFLLDLMRYQLLRR